MGIGTSGILKIAVFASLPFLVDRAAVLGIRIIG
jgi:hypothetical protein